MQNQWARNIQLQYDKIGKMVHWWWCYDIIFIVMWHYWLLYCQSFEQRRNHSGGRYCTDMLHNIITKWLKLSERKTFNLSFFKIWIQYGLFVFPSWLSFSNIFVGNPYCNTIIVLYFFVWNSLYKITPQVVSKVHS